MTKWLHFHFSLSCIGEGNGNPLQCSCLENPRDGEAWWAAIYGVAQSWTRLKWLSKHFSHQTSPVSTPSKAIYVYSRYPLNVRMMTALKRINTASLRWSYIESLSCQTTPLLHLWKDFEASHHFPNWYGCLNYLWKQWFLFNKCFPSKSLVRDRQRVPMWPTLHKNRGLWLV